MPAETLVPPRFRAPEPQPRRRALTLAIVVCALATVLFALAPGQADAAPAGPFDVEGPADAYAWDGAVLSVTGDGVTIAGMAHPTSAAMGDVRVAAGVGAINVGSGVRIGTLSYAGVTALRLDGAGNEVQAFDLTRPANVSGPGSVTIAEATLPLDLLPSATVTLTGGAYSMSIWAGATLVLEPGASLSNITHFGGLLGGRRLHVEHHRGAVRGDAPFRAHDARPPVRERRRHRHRGGRRTRGHAPGRRLVPHHRHAHGDVHRLGGPSARHRGGAAVQRSDRARCGSPRRLSCRT